MKYRNSILFSLVKFISIMLENEPSTTRQFVLTNGKCLSLEYVQSAFPGATGLTYNASGKSIV